MKSWIRKIVLEEENDLAEKLDSKPSLAEEAAAAAKAAAAAAADVAKASLEMLQSRNEGGIMLGVQPISLKRSVSYLHLLSLSLLLCNV